MYLLPFPSPLNASSIIPKSSFLNGSIIPKSVIPEWFYQESKLFKGKNIWIPDKRFRV